MIDKWVFRRTTCKGIYTHPDITCQVIVDNHAMTITWNELRFNSVEEAKAYAEKYS